MSLNKGKAKPRIEGKDSVKIKNRTMPHFNGHQLVAVGVKYYPNGEIKDLSLFPVNKDGEPIMTPLMLKLRSSELSRDDGESRYDLMDRISSWHLSMRLPRGKKLMLLVWDSIKFHSDFLKLVDSEFEYLVDRYKDVKQMAYFENDIAAENGLDIPYPKEGLSSALSRSMGSKYLEDCKNDAPYLAIMTAKLYRHCITRTRSLLFMEK